MPDRFFYPLYFFSLMGGLAYGWRVGLAVGAFSPLMSFWLTGMPLMPVLQFVILKSAILGFFGGYMSERLSQRNLFSISLLAIGFMQLVGIATIFLITRSWQMAMADMIVGYPGLILMQTLGAPIAKKLHSYEGQTPTRNHS